MLSLLKCQQFIISKWRTRPQKATIPFIEYRNTEYNPKYFLTQKFYLRPELTIDMLNRTNENE